MIIQIKIIHYICKSLTSNFLNSIYSLNNVDPFHCGPLHIAKPTLLNSLTFSVDCGPDVIYFLAPPPTFYIHPHPLGMVDPFMVE